MAPKRVDLLTPHVLPTFPYRAAVPSIQHHIDPSSPGVVMRTMLSAWGMKGMNEC